MSSLGSPRCASLSLNRQAGVRVQGGHSPGLPPWCLCSPSHVELSQWEDDSTAVFLPALKENPVVQRSLMFFCQIEKHFFFFCRHHYSLAIKFLLYELSK